MNSPVNPISRRVLLSTLLFFVVVLALWQFPRFWYTRVDASVGSFWLAEQSKIEGWDYEEIPVSKSAEKVLVADRLINGEFRRGDQVVRVFSAKRYAESQNEIGLFVHTPDRCWTEAGWKMEHTQPDFKELTVHGINIQFERRIFTTGSTPELVYFAGLVGGQSLPYRLDHNLSVGMKHARKMSKDNTGTALRAVDDRYWGRVMDSFLARRPLHGPKQFVRISTPIRNDDVNQADLLLTQFLSSWLRPVDYSSEWNSWKAVGRSSR